MFVIIMPTMVERVKMTKTKNNKKRIPLISKEERFFISTPPGRVSVIAWIISVVCLIGWWILDILILNGVLVGDDWELFQNVLDMIGWPCLAVATSIDLTALYFIKHKNK